MNNMQQESDHDLLITLNAKFDNLSTDVKMMGDGFKQRVRDLEGRVSAIEKVNTEINLPVAYQRFVKVEEGFKQVKWLMWLIGFLALIISWTTGFLNQILTLFNNK